MSDFIEINKLSPTEAMNQDLDAGYAAITITLNNGCIEVEHSDKTVLFCATKVKRGTWNDLWSILYNCGQVEYSHQRNIN